MGKSKLYNLYSTKTFASHADHRNDLVGVSLNMGLSEATQNLDKIKSMHELGKSLLNMTNRIDAQIVEAIKRQTQEIVIRLNPDQKTNVQRSVQMLIVQALSKDASIKQALVITNPLAGLVKERVAALSIGLAREYVRQAEMNNTLPLEKQDHVQMATFIQSANKIHAQLHGKLSELIKIQFEFMNSQSTKSNNESLKIILAAIKSPERQKLFSENFLSVSENPEMIKLISEIETTLTAPQPVQTTVSTPHARDAQTTHQILSETAHSSMLQRMDSYELLKKSIIKKIEDAIEKINSKSSFTQINLTSKHLVDGVLSLRKVYQKPHSRYSDIMFLNEVRNAGIEFVGKDQFKAAAENPNSPIAAIIGMIEKFYKEESARTANEDYLRRKLNEYFEQLLSMKIVGNSYRSAANF